MVYERERLQNVIALLLSRKRTKELVCTSWIKETAVLVIPYDATNISYNWKEQDNEA